MNRAIVACVVAACFLVPSAATAKPRKIESSITATFTDNEATLPIPGVFTDDPDTFSGTVRSDNAKCVEGRSIKVVKKNAEGEVLGVAAVATTKAGGTWTTNKEDPTPGTYVAVVTRKAIAGEGRSKICLGAASGEMTVE